MSDDDFMYGCGCFVFVVLPWLVGMMIAVTVSWGIFHSVLYAAFHGLLGWLWLAYHFLA